MGWTDVLAGLGAGLTQFGKGLSWQRELQAQEAEDARKREAEAVRRAQEQQRYELAVQEAEQRRAQNERTAVNDLLGSLDIRTPLPADVVARARTAGLGGRLEDRAWAPPLTFQDLTGRTSTQPEQVAGTFRRPTPQEAERAEKQRQAEADLAQAVSWLRTLPEGPGRRVAEGAVSGVRGLQPEDVETAAERAQRLAEALEQRRRETAITAGAQQATHRANRLFDVAHPIDTSERDSPAFPRGVRDYLSGFTARYGRAAPDPVPVAGQPVMTNVQAAYDEYDRALPDLLRDHPRLDPNTAERYLSGLIGDRPKPEPPNPLDALTPRPPVLPRPTAGLPGGVARGARLTPPETAPLAGERVRVKLPDGRVGTVGRAQLAEALRLGAVVLP